MKLETNMNINYRVSFEDPSSHLLNIELIFEEINAKEIDLHLPSWRPGRYLILDFAGDLQNFKAMDINNKKLNWKKTDKNTWNIKLINNSLVVRYEMYANEFNLRTKGLDSEHAFINPVSVFMFSEITRKNKINLQIKQYSDWIITTGLKQVQDLENTYIAKDYDELADSPIEIGKQLVHKFSYDNKSYEVMLYGSDKMNFKRFEDDFKKIIDENLKFWGAYPYESYIILIHCSETSGGGTEHINSTVVGCKPFVFENDNAYKDFLRLISHEFFHTWNVKQMRPAGITPYNYLDENYTEELWIAEGGTSYYDGMILLRTGHYNRNDLFNEIKKYINDERNRPGNKIQSLAESSFDAWIKFWRGRPQRFISESDYYAKGSYVSLLLDLEIRNSTKNKYSLDHIYRYIFENFPKDVKGYTNIDFFNVIGMLTGSDFNWFSDKYIYNTDELDWENTLQIAGLQVLENINVNNEKEFNILQISFPNTLQKQIFESIFNLSWSDSPDILNK